MKPGEEKVWLDEFPGAPDDRPRTTVVEKNCGYNNNTSSKEELALGEHYQPSTRRSPLQVRFVDETQVDDCPERQPIMANNY